VWIGRFEFVWLFHRKRLGMFEIVLVNGPHHGRKLYVEKCADRPSSVAFPAEPLLDVVTGNTGLGAEVWYELEDDEVSPVQGCSMSYSRTTDPMVWFPGNHCDDEILADSERTRRGCG
jgi:hypothetical protein